MPEDSPGRKVNLNKPTMKPDDTIVLEFGGGGRAAPNRSKYHGTVILLEE